VLRAPITTSDDRERWTALPDLMAGLISDGQKTEHILAIAQKWEAIAL
jgi:hypothetical protein